MHGRGCSIVSTRDDGKDILAVQNTLQGNTEAFSDIVGRYTPVVYSLAARTLGDTEEAEDAVQEVFLHAYKSLRSFRIGSRFYPWLYTIALNEVRSRLRRRSRMGILGSLDANPQIPVSDRRIDVEKQVIGTIEEERALATLDVLPPRLRLVFVLRFLEDLPLKDISILLKIPVGTVKARVHRARKKLIGFLTDSDETG